VAYIAEIAPTGNDARRLKKQFNDLSKAAQAEGVNGYKEPSAGEYWWAQLVPSSGVAYLQRLAWELWRNKPLPAPGTNDEDSIHDGILFDMAEHLADWIGGTNKKGQSFEHLCFHPPRRGYWIPVEFESVLLVGDKFDGCLGSSVRLLGELEALAGALKLDLTTDHEDKKMWAAATNPGPGKARWQKYGIESFNCLRMYRACQKSIELGAAIKLS
jgi:hypothetical protein